VKDKSTWSNNSKGEKMNKILIPKEGNSTFTMIYAKTGSRCEPENIKGISHFLEHLMFKGTRTKTAKEIAYSIERYGAQINAYTDYELTAYWIKSANKYKGKAEALLMDMLYNSFFPQVEIDKERNVILQEMKMYEDDPRSSVGEIFQKALYQETDGLYSSIIGTAQSLANINRTTLLDYYKNRYKDLTFLQIGEVEKDTSYNKSAGIATKVPNTKELRGRNDVIVKRAGINQANVIIGNTIRPIGKHSLDTIVLTDLLEGVMNDMSGRLFSKVREENNLCYRIYFSLGGYSCGTLNWGVSLGLNADQINKAYDLIMGELTKEISDTEIEYSISKKVGERAINNDTLNSLANYTAYLDLRGIDYKEYLFNYEKYAREQAKNLREFAKSINFTDNVVAQLIPE
jgi:predicted Zn-dependent peptidase